MQPLPIIISSGSHKHSHVIGRLIRTRIDEYIHPSRRHPPLLTLNTNNTLIKAAGAMDGVSSSLKPGQEERKTQEDIEEDEPDDWQVFPSDLQRVADRS